MNRRPVVRRIAYVAATVCLIAPAFFLQSALAASPGPSQKPADDTAACNPAKGPPLNSRFRGIGRVGLFNGVYSFDRLDLTRDGSIAATFSRGYISGDTRVNNMGIGWSSNYGVRLRAFHPTDLVFTDPFGFSSQFFDAYASPTTIDVMQRMTLTQGTPNWTVSDGQTTWTLNDPSGNLVHVETADGASLDVHYVGDRPTDTIAPDGTGLLFELDAKGRFVQVTDRQDKGRWIRFAYDLNDRLSQVDRPWGTTEHYAYIGETQQIQTISNGLDVPLFRIDYDERGRTIAERDALGLIDGQAVDYQYEDLPDGSVRTTVTYPESRLDPTWRPIQTAVHDSKGNLTEVVVQPTRTEGFVGRYEYNAANRRVVLRDACDLASAADMPPPPPPPSPLAVVLKFLADFVRQIIATLRS